MGLLVNGQWQDQWYDTDKTGGKFERESSQFDAWVEPNSSQRYRLYVSLACPWAFRTIQTAGSAMWPLWHWALR